MPSFDIVSEVNMHEVTNAIDQTNREIGTRYDFKGTGAAVEQTDSGLTLHAENDFQIQQMLDILYRKMAKRGIEIGALTEGKVVTSGGKASLTVAIRQGIDQDTARQIVRRIKDSKIKVQGSIQGDKIRVSGKKRDDLQEVIGLLKDSNAGLPLQYLNFRD